MTAHSGNLIESIFLARISEENGIGFLSFIMFDFERNIVTFTLLF